MRKIIITDISDGAGAGNAFEFRFTDWSVIGPHDISHLDVSQCNPFTLRDCQFHGGGLYTYLGPVINLTNCLFERVYLSLYPDDANNPSLRNNLFYGGALDLLPFGTYHSVVQDNLFDHTAMVDNHLSCSYTGYNAYVTNCDRLQPTTTNDIVLTNSLAYQTGPLGNYYQPTNSLLINAGSVTAMNADLQDYTVLTNQTPDTGTVDMGYHYQLTGGNSTGTDFWLAFCNGYYDYLFNLDLSLHISSPVGAVGTVTIPGFTINGPVLVVTNCGDTALNGTYVQTNTDLSYETVYANGDYLVGFNGVTGEEWDMAYYDGYDFELLYYTPDINLSTTNWVPYEDSASPPTTSCAQIPFTQSFSVRPGTVANVEIPWSAMITDYNTNESKGIHVTASQPVSVYGLEYDPAASTAFTAYPTPLLGTNYCVIAYSTIINYYSQFAVVATANNTTITITPSATAILAGHTTSYTNILQQGQVYQIYDSSSAADVTGTFIKSDKPIGVFAGDYLAWVPNSGTTAGNPLEQEQLPIEQWGTNALAISFAGRTGGDLYRILAAYSNTVVTINGTIVVTNQAGGFYDTNIDGPVIFQGSKSIQVAQFANGNDSDGSGDPCEILLPPTGHYLNSYTVFTPTNVYAGIEPGFTTNCLNLIVAQSGISTALVDGLPVGATNFTAIGSSGYYGAQVAVTKGVHTVNSSQPVEVQVYGFISSDAYGYFGGVVNFP